MLQGKVYKLYKEGCNYCYIGSTYLDYFSVRMAHHRQAHRRGEKDYKGLFDGGDPSFEFLEIVELESRDEASKLRKAEDKWITDSDNCINVRKSYLSEDEKKVSHEKCVKRYHESPLGRISVRKATLNQKLKKMNGIKSNKELIKQINNEIKFLDTLSESIREGPDSS